MANDESEESRGVVVSNETTPLLGNGGASNSNGNGNGNDSGNGGRGWKPANGSPADGDDDADDRVAAAVAAAAETTSRARLALILGTAYVGVFMGAADASVMATLAASIASEFQSLRLMSWLAAAYMVASAACQPVSGRLTDVIGRGPGLVASNLLFAAGNLQCALARDAPAMLTGRAVAGLGGGGLMSISTFLASDLVPLRRRGVIQGVGNIAYGAGAMLGGVLGGLTEGVWTGDGGSGSLFSGWRLAFWVQVPVAGVSAVLVYFLVRVPPHPAADDVDAGGNSSSSNGFPSAWAQLRRIDFPGAGFLVAFLALLLLGLNAGGSLVPWTHPLVLTAVPLSLASLGAFVWWEARRAVHPIIPVHLVVQRTVLAACVTNLVGTAAMMTSIYYVPLYLQVCGASAAGAGLRLLCSPLGVSVSSVGSGLVMKRTGRYLRLGVAALVVFVAAYVVAVAGLAAVPAAGEAAPSSSSRELAFYAPFVHFFLIGLGYGAMLTITLLACLASVAHAHQAVVTSATYAFRTVGGTAGLTLASVVFQNTLRAQLWARCGHLPGAEAEIARIRDDLAALRHLPPGWADGVQASLSAAFRGVWLLTLGLALIGLLSVSLMKQHTLHSTLARS